MTKQDIIENARKWGCKVHEDTNHRYDQFSYSYHLGMVAIWARQFNYLLGEQDAIVAEAAAWTHDSIEDARQTFNDVAKAIGEEIAEVTYALTNEKGKNRKERANDKYYAGIRANHVAVYVKLCDRLANTQHSVETKSRMAELYKKELPEFVNQLGVEEGHEFWPMVLKLKEMLGNS